MKNSIKKELASHIIDVLNNQYDNDCIDFSELHFKAFNEDYYIVYYSVALEWLKKHDIDCFEAINIVKNYGVDNFGEVNTEINSEKIVNMLAYIYGEELVYSLDIDLSDTTKIELIDILETV